MSKKKSRIKKPIYTVRNILRQRMKKSEAISSEREFYEKHMVIIWAVVIFIMLPTAIYLWGLFQEKKTRIQVPQNVLSEVQLQKLNLKYSHGFKVLEITQDKIKPTSIDTFSEPFRAHWASAKILKFDSGEIRVYLPDVYYELGQLRGETLDATISRRPEEVFEILSKPTGSITLEILEDSGDKILCALSVR